MLGVLAVLNYAEQREILIEYCPLFFATVSQSIHNVSSLLRHTLVCRVSAARDLQISHDICQTQT